MAQGIAVSVSIILARILMPDDYGLIAMVMVFIAIANVFVVSGFGNALIQKKDADSIDFSSVFFFNIAFSIFLYIVLFLMSPYIAEYYSMPTLSPVLKVLGLTVVISGVTSVQYAFVSKNMLFRRLFWSTLFGTLFSGVLGLILAYHGFGVWALVVQSLSSSLINTMVLWFTISWRPTRSFSFLRLKGLFLFGWKMLFEGLSVTIFGKITNLVIGKVYTSSDLGYFTKAQQFPQLLVSNITTSMSSVLFPAMAMRQDDRAQVTALLRKSVVLSSYVIFPMLTGLAIVAKPFVVLLLTEKWIQTVPYLQIFCYTNAATVGMISRHQALNAIGRSDVFMNEHLVSRITGIILLLLFYRISVMAIALIGIASSLILTLTVMYTSRRYNNYRYRAQIADVLPTMILCVCMGVPVYFIQYMDLSIFFILIVQVVSGAAIYMGLSGILKPNGYRETLPYIIRAVEKIRSGHGNNIIS